MKNNLTDKDFRFIKLCLIANGSQRAEEIANKIHFESNLSEKRSDNFYKTKRRDGK